MHEMRQQRQCEKTVSDGRFERRFTAGAVNVHVDPLMVERGVGKLLDALLRDFEPIGNSDFLTDQVFEGIREVESAFGHRSKTYHRGTETRRIARNAKERRIKT